MRFIRSSKAKWGMAGTGAALLLLVAGLGAQNASVTVRDAWMRVPGGGQNVAAMFMIVENHTNSPRAIVGVTTDVAEKAELHEAKVNPTTKMMSMTPVKQVAIPANGSAMLQPGGFHVMMFNLKKRPMAGDTVNATLKLDDGTTVAVAAKARGPEDGDTGTKKKM